MTSLTRFDPQLKQATYYIFDVSVTTKINTADWKKRNYAL